MPTVIEVQHLIKKYNKAAKNAVNDISFSVNQGEFFTLLGPNGAGKTTTISILNTTLAKTSGTLKVNGFDIDTQPSQVRQRIGVIFQNPSLDLNLTAEENIRFHAVLYGLYPFRPTFQFMPEAYRKRVENLAAILGLGNEIHNPIKTFSGGMKRKLEIIRGLMHNPTVLFLDEPTTGLDPESRKNLWNYLAEVRQKEGTTIFLTTHYLDEAENADNVCVINGGNIVAFGTPQKLKDQFVEEYLLLDSQKRPALTKELQKMKVRFTGEGPFKIQVQSSQIQKIISTIKSPLSDLKIHAPTLEEAYLEIISKKDHEES
jgi:ABC-2 type transport system ATP-binding protein